MCYLPGLKNQLADCLSRAGGLQDSIKLPKLSIYQITSLLNVRSDSLQQLCEASQADDTLAILKYTIQKGWPSTIKELSSQIRTLKSDTTILDIQGGTDHCGCTYIDRYKNSSPKHETSRNTQADP